MEGCCVHHVEIGVRDGEEFCRNFMKQYQFSLIATRKTPDFLQWVLASGTARFVISQERRLSNNPVQSDQYVVGWSFGDGENNSFLNADFDSVYNIALQIKDLKSCVDKLTRCGVKILRPIQNIRDSGGEVKFAVVKSCVGNVVHTLVEESSYKGVFLPGFESVPVCDNIPDDKLLTHFDHVTFSCPCGDSDSILEWYSRFFGMRRFLINRQESEADGFVIDTEDIGLRLKVFEYWKCAETGLIPSSRPDSVKFVIGEPLPKQGPNQINTFLTEHGGPGVQHIGLNTSNIVHTVAKLAHNGVDFAEPPYTYYTEVGKLQEIHDIGENIEVLQKNGILVDAEADPDIEAGDDRISKHKYLMQKFTKPLFDRNTFFLEIIQRIGAQGFGSGNITALWRSVQAYMSEKKC